MATKKNPEDVPAVPLPPAAPESSAPESSAPAEPVTAEPAARAEIPTPPPAPYGAPAAPAAERPDPYAAPPAYSAPPASAYSAPPASAYSAPPAGGQVPPPYGAPAAPYGTAAAPYGSQQPYAPGAYYPPAAPQGMSIAAMITGIGSIVFTFAGFGFLPGIAAVILGQIAKKSQPHARGFWLTGIITGWVAIGLGVLTGLFFLAVIFLPFLLGAASFNY